MDINCESTQSVYFGISRTDNSVKNYFYATLRRCLRKVNKIVGRNLGREYHKVETSVLYRIIEGI